MSSQEEQNNENFKLVSLDGGPRPGSQQAKRAYTSYLKDDENGGADSSSNIQITESDPNDEASAPVIVQKPSPTAQSKKPQSKGTKNLGTQTLQAPPTPAPTKNKDGKSYKTSDDGVDLFNGESVEDVSERLDELKNSVSILATNMKNTFSALFMKASSVLMKPVGLMAGVVAKLANIPLKVINKTISSLSNKMGSSAKALGGKDAQQMQEEVQQEAPKVELVTSNFSEMIELNIFFTDNYKKNLYTKSKNVAFKLSKMEEELILGLAMEAIRECAEFTAELPPPQSGPYEGIPVSEIMINVTSQDVAIFLGFVKAFPGKYIGKSWKISETFATWLINNSPLG